MDVWTVGLAGNLVITAAYLAIGLRLAVRLRRTGQLWVNPLGLATAAIFLSCAAGHGEHSLHLLGWGIGPGVTAAARRAHDLHLAAIDIATAMVAVWYWALRRHDAGGEVGMFTDRAARRRQALQLNDDVIQGLAVAKHAIAIGDQEQATAALDATTRRVQGIVDGLLDRGRRPLHGPALRRERPSVVLEDR